MFLSYNMISSSSPWMPTWIDYLICPLFEDVSTNSLDQDVKKHVSKLINLKIKTQFRRVVAKLSQSRTVEGEAWENIPNAHFT